MSHATPPSGYVRRLGLFTATMLVVGGIIGSGIFRNAGDVVARVGTAKLTMTAWGLGAVIALIGAFIFAELGQRRPAAGGGYAYLREAFGPLAGFLYAWGLLLIIATGAIAAVAMTCAGYATDLLGLPEVMQKPLAALAIISLTLVNIAGVQPAAWTQNVFTILKLAAIAVLIGAVFLAPVNPAVAAAPPPTVPSGSVALALAAALTPVLFSFGGWQQTNFMAEELIAPERNLPRALILGMLIVVAAYMLVNIAYLRAMPLNVLARSSAPAAEVMAGLAGDTGRKLISAGIVASTFGFLNLVIMVSPRVYQAMARDGLFFQSFADIHPTTHTPVNAIIVQGVWAIVLLFSNTYGALLDYVVFADWIFFGLTAATLFVLRRHDGGRATPFQVPWHPVSTVAFILAAIYVVSGSVISNVENALLGAGLLLLGLPIYFHWRRRATVP